MRDLKIKLRPHHFCEIAARNGHRVYWVSLHEQDRKVRYNQTGIPNVFDIILTDPIYFNFKQSKPINSPKSISQLAEKFKDREVILIVNVAYWIKIALELQNLIGARIVYDVLDRLESFEDLKPNKDKLLNHHGRLLVRSDAVTYTAKDMVDYVGRAGNPVHIPNGCDPSIWDIPRKEFPGPDFIGYFGALNYWFDTTVARYLLNSSNYKTQFMGPMCKKVKQQLWIGSEKRFMNSQYLGIVDYFKLPKIGRTWSAGLIPFKDVALTKATDPNKLYEYYALGIPVVAARLNELQNISDEMPELIRPYLVTPGQSIKWDRAIKKAMAEDSEEKTIARKAWARENTWESRWNKLIKQVEVKPYE